MTNFIYNRDKNYRLSKISHKHLNLILLVNISHPCTRFTVSFATIVLSRFPQNPDAISLQFHKIM